MLGLNGWYGVAGAPFQRREYIEMGDGGEGPYGYLTFGTTWAYPISVGDTITDASGLSDVVVSIVDPYSHVIGRLSYDAAHIAAWDGSFPRLATITRTLRHRSVVDFVGDGSARDGGAPGTTDLTADTLSTVATMSGGDPMTLSGEDWDKSSVVFLQPTEDLDIYTAYPASNGVKTLVNDGAFAVRIRSLGTINENNIHTPLDANFYLYPGDTAVMVRDTIADVWRAQKGGTSHASLLDIGALLGSRMRFRMRADTYVSSSPPDVDSAENIANPGIADVSEAVAATRPHVSTVRGASVFDFSGSQSLSGYSGVSENILDAGDLPTVFVVAMFDGFGSVRGAFEMSTDGATVNNGIAVDHYSVAGALRCYFRADVGMIVPSSASFSDTSGLHVISSRLTADDAVLALDGVGGTPVVTANAGLNSDLPYIDIGQYAGDSLRIDGKIAEIIIARDVTADEVITINAALASYYGLTNPWAQRTFGDGYAGSVLGECLHGSTMLFVGTSGGIQSSADDGASWVARAPAGGFSSAIYDIASDGTTLCLVGASAEIQTSSDGGVTWVAHAADDYASFFYTVISHGGSFVAAGVTGVIQSSSDSGATWAEQTDVGSHSYYCGASNGTTAVFAGSSGNIVTATSDLSSWTARAAGGGFANDFLGGCAHGSTLVLVGALGAIQTSSDEGVTWVPRTADNAFTGSFYVAASNGTLIMIAGQSGEIQTSSDGGVTWVHGVAGESYTNFVTAGLIGSTTAAIAGVNVVQTAAVSALS